MSPNGAPRLPEFGYEGCTFPRRPVFEKLDAGAWVRDQLLRTSDLHRFSLTAYCVMPDHVHFLAEAMRDDCRLVLFVSAWKQTTGYYWKKSTRENLWQRGFFDHVLRDDEDERGVVRYIVGNPVRAGLVASPVDYPLSGSSKSTCEQIAEAIADWSPYDKKGRRG